MFSSLDAHNKSEWIIRIHDWTHNRRCIDTLLSPLDTHCKILVNGLLSPLDTHCKILVNGLLSPLDTHCKILVNGLLSPLDTHNQNVDTLLPPLETNDKF